LIFGIVKSFFLKKYLIANDRELGFDRHPKRTRLRILPELTNTLAYRFRNDELRFEDNYSMLIPLWNRYTEEKRDENRIILELKRNVDECFSTYRQTNFIDEKEASEMADMSGFLVDHIRIALDVRYIEKPLNTKCSVCLKDINKIAVKLRCGHFFHVKCLYDLWYGDMYQHGMLQECPTCGEEIEAAIYRPERERTLVCKIFDSQN
jgi:hypothetical protein